MSNTVAAEEVERYYLLHASDKEWKIDIAHRDSLRKQFLKQFPLELMERISIDDYAIGRNDDNFSYSIEQTYKDLGYIFGSTSKKFGVYFGELKPDHSKHWRIGNKSLGGDVNEAFLTVREEIVKLIKSSQFLSQEEFKRNKISSMLKLKILSIYHHEEYLPIFSDVHLAHFANEFGLPVDGKGHIDLQKALKEYKLTNKAFASLSNMEFGRLLYATIRPTKEESKSAKKELTQARELHHIDLSSVDSLGLAIGTNFGEGRGKTDFSKQDRRNRATGATGEARILQYEKDYLKSHGRNDLACKVKHVALKDDGFGYDIESYEINGEPKFIEVKSSKGGMKTSRYYLSRNEYEVGKIKKGYSLYILSDLNKTQVKLLKIDSPFTRKDLNISLEPTQFFLAISRRKAH